MSAILCVTGFCGVFLSSGINVQKFWRETLSFRVIPETIYLMMSLGSLGIKFLAWHGYSDREFYDFSYNLKNAS
jgi:hypothetical protein